jgi:hypothetical protein
MCYVIKYLSDVGMRDHGVRICNQVPCDLLSQVNYDLETKTPALRISARVVHHPA